MNIQSAVLTPFDISQTANDNDAWVSYANLAGLFNNTPTAVPLNSPLWAMLNANDWNVQGNMGSGYSTSLGSAGLYGNAWLIGAGNPNPDRNDDGFKLSSIVVNTPTVPEPATWAMMLFGFGAVGASLRRAKTDDSPASASLSFSSKSGFQRRGRTTGPQPSNGADPFPILSDGKST